MNDSKKKLTEEELKLIEETELFMEEVYSNPEVANAPLPPNMRENIFKEIRAREAEKERQKQEEQQEKQEQTAEVLSDEDKELIRLGKIYKKRRKFRKFYVLAAVLVLAMAFGVTSIGGPEKVFERVVGMLTGREQVNVDSEDITKTSNMDEEKVYQEIEEKFGFTPVKFAYLPEGVIFLEGEIGEDIQCINLIYGEDDVAKIAYLIRPNYRLSSIGKDVEDEFEEEYIEENEYTTIYIRKYLMNEEEERWSIQFEYKDVAYSISITDTTKEEVEKIVKNLFLS